MSRSPAPLRPERRLSGLGGTPRLRLTIGYDAPDENGWIVARIHGIPGAISQGRTREEARENVLDALRFMLAPDGADENTDGSEPLELLLQS